MEVQITIFLLWVLVIAEGFHIFILLRSIIRRNKKYFVSLGKYKYLYLFRYIYSNLKSIDTSYSAFTVILKLVSKLKMTLYH